jgi:hypothetical protein
MKQRNVVSMLGALVLIISAVVLITGCPPANSNKNNSTLKISFDEAKIECKRNDLMVKSGIMVTDGELLIFSAKNVPDGKIAEWRIGATVKKASSLFYHVTKADADTSGVITISCEIKDAAKSKIIFDGAKIKATKKGKNDIEISSAAEVNEGDRIYFRIKKPTSNKVAVWTVNNKPASFDSNIASLNYSIKAQDADSEGNINVSYTERNMIELTIQFDSSKVKCTQKRDGTEVVSNSKHSEGTELKFETVNGKTVEWKIGSVTYRGKKVSIGSTLHKFYADKDNVVHVEYTNNTKKI